MTKGRLAMVMGLGAVLALATSTLQVARADQLEDGKKIFTMEDSNGHSCAECHPKGGSNGKVLKGKKVSSLVDNVDRLSDDSLREKIRKHLDQDVDIKLTDAQFEALVAFVASLPKKGY